MRWFAFSLMLLSGAMVGCEAPKEKIEAEVSKEKAETSLPSPSVDSASSAVTGESEPAQGEAAAPPTPAATEPAPAAAEPAAAPAPAATEPAPAAEPKPDSASTKGGEAVRFVATKSVKVPTMMCPYACWPKVKETLAAMPGVEGVQLAAQAKETEIDNPVVELKTTAEFDVEAAIAALAKVNFEDAVVVK